MITWNRFCLCWFSRDFCLFSSGFQDSRLQIFYGISWFQIRWWVFCGKIVRRIRFSGRGGIKWEFWLRGFNRNLGSWGDHVRFWCSFMENVLFCWTILGFDFIFDQISWFQMIGNCFDVKIDAWKRLRNRFSWCSEVVYRPWQSIKYLWVTTHWCGLISWFFRWTVTRSSFGVGCAWGTLRL